MNKQKASEMQLGGKSKTHRNYTIVAKKEEDVNIPKTIKDADICEVFWLVDQYPYKREDGTLFGIKGRYETSGEGRKKTFRWFHTGQNGSLIWKKPQGQSPPYRAKEIKNAAERGWDIVFVEGEKDCNTAVQIGLTGDVLEFTTIDGNIKNTDLDFLLDFQGNIYILPDDDEPGIRKVLKIFEFLSGRFPDANVEIIQPIRLNENNAGVGTDLTDAFNVGKWNKEKIENHINLNKITPETLSREWGIKLPNASQKNTIRFILDDNRNTVIDTHENNSERRKDTFNITHKTIAEKQMRETGGKNVSPIRYFLDNGLMKDVHHTVFIPQENPGILMDTFINDTVFNSWRPEMMTQPISVKSSDDLLAEQVKFLLFCLALISGIVGEENTKHFMNFVAHLVQKPGTIIGHMPLIKGVQGIGKTTIGKIIEATIGENLCREIDREELASSFSDWRTGNLLGIIEELAPSRGTHKGDIYEALKTSITNNAISIVPKGRKGYKVRNVQNYIAFTNEDAPIKIPDDDRRIWVIQCPFNSKDEMLVHLRDTEKQIPDTAEEFFNVIVEGLNEKKNRTVLAWHFRTIRISDEFSKNRDAPRTIAKDEMREEYSQSIEYYSDVKDFIDRSFCPIVSPTLFVSPFAWSMIEEEITPQRKIPNQAKNTILKRLSYTRFPGRHRLNGSNPCNIWHKRLEDPLMDAEKAMMKVDNI